MSSYLLSGEDKKYGLTSWDRLKQPFGLTVRWLFRFAGIVWYPRRLPWESTEGSRLWLLGVRWLGAGLSLETWYLVPAHNQDFMSLLSLMVSYKLRSSALTNATTLVDPANRFIPFFLAALCIPIADRFLVNSALQDLEVPRNKRPPRLCAFWYRSSEKCDGETFRHFSGTRKRDIQWVRDYEFSGFWCFQPFLSSFITILSGQGW